ncbi:hypothetical protein VSR01_00680 [Actinacidiphila sp. DG2A-62]|jgi:hypothetical protein|uniref:hypothetical protein n=1 Tax=Actinacidiphila sp. DG2A-62 TaxID=3108821 RepID=UPI002DB7F280|nr:hypothetical protein [Actinacidiphila sp. DG2A-62]MEC3992137.1 hypothetical protein [Actinacidiphila sp. DG2A-62]
MADAIEPTPEETEQPEVEAHGESALSLQELEGQDGFVEGPGLADGSSVSLAACA